MAAQKSASDPSVSEPELTAAADSAVAEVIAETKAEEATVEAEVHHEAAPAQPARALAAEAKIMNYVVAAAALSAVPVPLFDVVAVMALQVRMVQKLAEMYERPFKTETVRTIITSLTGGVVGYGVGAAAGYAVRMIPVVGTALRAVSVPAASAATTYAVGKVFMKHFEEGGSIFDLEVEGLKTFYQEQRDRAKAFKMKKKASPAVMDEVAAVAA